MDLLTPVRKERHPVELQLTSMIDVVSLIIIYMVGAFFGGSGTELPGNVKLPQSISKDLAETAPSILVTPQYLLVMFSKTSQKIPLDQLVEGGSAEQEIEKISKLHLSAIPADKKTNPVLLNIVGDQSVSYEHIFNISKLFRKNGFTTLLFLTEAEKKR